MKVNIQNLKCFTGSKYIIHAFSLYDKNTNALVGYLKCIIMSEAKQCMQSLNPM